MPERYPTHVGAFLSRSSATPARTIDVSCWRRIRLPFAAAAATAEARATGYLSSQLLRACFCASSFMCLAARFSLIERPGFLGWAVGLDFCPILRRVRRLPAGCSVIAGLL